MSKLTCTNCSDSFHRENGYSGTLERPFCLKSDCLKAYLAPAAAVMKSVAALQTPAPNGFDDVQYRDQQQRGKKG